MDRGEGCNRVGWLRGDEIRGCVGEGGSGVVGGVVNVNNEKREVGEWVDGVNGGVRGVRESVEDGIEVEVGICGGRGVEGRVEDYEGILKNK